MSDPFLGEIRMFGGNFAPRGWALCDGQMLSIAEYQTLFSILGTMYGGDGRTTFALPDLRGRLPMHAGTGPGLPERKVGEKGILGYVREHPEGANRDRPNPERTEAVPFGCVNFIIALEGIYPSRS